VGAPTGLNTKILLHAIIFWIFVEQGKIMEADEPTVQVGAIPSELTPHREDNGGRGIDSPVDATPTETNGAPTPKTLPYYAGCPSCRVILPIYPGLGQAPIYAGLHTRWLGSYPVAWLHSKAHINEKQNNINTTCFCTIKHATVL